MIGDIDDFTVIDDQANHSDLAEIDIDRIERGQFQPRQTFDQQALNELADSIRSHGVVQPVVLRPKGDNFELVAGERRWRAAQLAGLDKIPAVVRAFEARSAAAIGLIENIQREDLNPLEEATALLRLSEEFELTHQQVADSVGRSRAAVTNLLRLLDLADRVKDQVNEGLLNMGHARALLALNREGQVETAAKVVKQGLSVRDTESLVRKTLAGESADKSNSNERDPDIRRLEDEVSEKLGAAVNIKSGKKGAGQLVIHFHSADELDGILQHLNP